MLFSNANEGSEIQGGNDGYIWSTRSRGGAGVIDGKAIQSRGGAGVIDGKGVQSRGGAGVIDGK